MNACNNKIHTKMVSIFLTSRCTLNCKYCGAQVPKFRSADITFDFNFDQTVQAIDVLFSIYDHIDHIDFTGGEPLLMQGKKNGLPELLKYIEKFHSQFDFMRILTNGTILPSRALVETIQSLQCPFDFYLDNYEGLSNNAENLKELCGREHIAYKEIHYGKDSQYCNGWVDFGDLSNKNYTGDEVKRVYDRCLQAHHSCLTLFNDTLYPCSVAPLGALLKKIPHSFCGGVELLDSATSLNEKRRAVWEFGNKILKACHYCNGFDSVNAPRFPAAEQA